MKAFRSMQGWLMLAAFLATAWLAYSLFSGDIRGSADGSGSLPKPFCADTKGSTEGFDQRVKTGSVTVIYNSGKGCNTTPDAQAKTTATEANKVLGTLARIGLSSKGTYAFASYRNNNLVQFSETSSGFALNTAHPDAEGDLLDFGLAQGLATMTVSRLAPDLAERYRVRIGSAFAYVAYGRKKALDEAQNRLASSGSLEAADEGLFEAWLMARYGSKPVLDALAACSQDCRWTRELDAQLRRQKTSYNREVRAFLRNFSPERARVLDEKL